MPRIKAPRTRGTKAREQREEKFIRIVTLRMKRILRELHMLKRCANRRLYGYTQEQVEEIAQTLDGQIEEINEAFAAPPDREPPVFAFGKNNHDTPLPL